MCDAEIRLRKVVDLLNAANNDISLIDSLADKDVIARKVLTRLQRLFKEDGYNG